MKFVLTIFLAVCLIKIRNIQSAILPEGCTTMTRIYSLITCQNLNTDDIPQNMPVNITGLEFYHSIFNSMQKTSFKRYQDLESISLYNVTIEKSLEKDFLVDLTDLAILIISNQSKLPAFEEIMWPQSLIRVNFNDMSLSELNLERLVKLETLRANRNNLKTFPILNKEAPLRHIELDSNQDIIVHVEDIIPYCRLFILNVDSMKPLHDCNCVRFKRWINENKIISNFETNICSDVKDINNCTFSYPPKLIKLREKCKRRESMFSTPNSTSIKFFLILILIFLLAFAIIVYCCWY